MKISFATNTINNNVSIHNGQAKNKAALPVLVEQNSCSVKSNPKLIYFAGNCHQSSFRDSIQSEIENGDSIAEGLKGKVYKVDINGKTYAVKLAKNSDCNFEQEAKLLKALPKSLQNGQQFVDYYKDKNGNDVLVSSFVKGSDGYLNSDNFGNLFKTILLHDKANVLHGDLNAANIIFDDKNNINFIDYGEGRIFSQDEAHPELYPDIVTNSNIVNLEHNGIPDALQTWNKLGLNTKDLFTDYLKSKGDFYSKHSQMLEQHPELNNQLGKCISYEKNLAQVLKNPSESVIQNEIKRMNILYTFEQADTSTNYEHKPLDSIARWNHTLKLTDEAGMFIDKQLEKSNLPVVEREYFENQKLINQSFCNNFTDWSTGTQQWLFDIKDKNESQLSSVAEKELKKNWSEEVRSPLPIDLRVLI